MSHNVTVPTYDLAMILVTIRVHKCDLKPWEEERVRRLFTLVNEALARQLQEISKPVEGDHHETT